MPVSVPEKELELTDLSEPFFSPLLKFGYCFSFSWIPQIRTKRLVEEPLKSWTPLLFVGKPDLDKEDFQSEKKKEKKKDYIKIKGSTQAPAGFASVTPHSFGGLGKWVLSHINRPGSLYVAMLVKNKYCIKAVFFCFLFFFF